MNEELRLAIIAVGSHGEEARRQVEVSPTDTVKDLYRAVAEALGSSTDNFKLSYKGEPLNDMERKVSSLGIKDGDTIYATVIAEGGLGLLRNAKGFLSSIFSSVLLSPNRKYHVPRRLSESEEMWLNVQFAGMLKHQPAAKAIDLRHYYYEHRAKSGPFKDRVFVIHMFISSPYDPPSIYCENPHGHPNFYSNGKLCLKTPWEPFTSSLWEYLERVKLVIEEPNYDSPAR